MQINSTKQICLIGLVYDISSGNSNLKSIFVNDGKIQKVIDGKADTTLLDELFVITFKDDEIIVPSLINLHTHIGYNILPVWESPNFWNNRFQWRSNTQYIKEIKDFVNFISKEWANTPLLNQYLSSNLSTNTFKGVMLEANTVYYDFYKATAISEIQRIHAILSEIQAVAGGTGLLLQTLDLDNEQSNMKHFLIRNTGNSDDLNLQQSQKIYAVVDLFRPDISSSGLPNEDTSNWKPQTQKTFNDFITSINNNNQPFFSTIAHIGEGKTGNIHLSQKDPYSKAECNELFTQLKSKADKMNLKDSNLSLVHSNGIDFTDKDSLKFLRENNINIIWSPVSNLLLYNDTLPIDKILNENINVCLGTDWTPSGSKHILDEIKFAKYYCDKFNMNIKDADIIKMASVNSAKALGNLKYSKIEEGAFADLFVIKNVSSVSIDNSITNSEDKNIKFVMINGRIVFGDINVFASLNVDYQEFPAKEGIFSSQKAISINSSLNFNLSNSIQKIDILMNNYSKNVLNKDIYRTKFLSSDDPQYLLKIEKLKTNL